MGVLPSLTSRQRHSVPSQSRTTRTSAGAAPPSAVTTAAGAWGRAASVSGAAAGTAAPGSTATSRTTAGTALLGRVGGMSLGLFGGGLVGEGANRPARRTDWSGYHRGVPTPRKTEIVSGKNLTFAPARG